MIGWLKIWEKLSVLHQCLSNCCFASVVLQDFTFQMGGEDAEADTFIKEGDEYFTASYFISLGYLELTHYKADDVQDYQTFSQAN